MNDQNAGAGGGSYGVNLDPGSGTRQLTGFAWSSNVGWVCFGATCQAHPSCQGTPPHSISPLGFVGSGNNARGWAKICNIPNDDGWISLNCTDSGAGCASTNYRVSVNTGSGNFSGYAWHGLPSAQGWGWIDFSGVRINEHSEIGSECSNGLDDDYDGDTDCADTDCKFVAPYCPPDEDDCALIGNTNCCSNGIDDDFDGAVDCAEGVCSTDPYCIPEICDNTIDDDGDGDIDCDDSECSSAPICTPAWLQSQYGNVYSQLGVEGNPPPPGQANATYCITTGGTISNFSSEYGCEEQGEESITLPVGTGGYVSTLGRLDVTGIINGRYADVVNMTQSTVLPDMLDGKVYLYECAQGDYNLNAKTFQNATGSGVDSRGTGLLVIKGCDLYINGDVTYQSSGVTNYLRNLASFGILVLTDYSGSPSGGSLYIDPSVGTVVGTIYAERAIYTGSTGSRFTDQQLEVYGALVSKEIRLERRWSSDVEPAEKVIFDGRAVVNPPPGFQDVAKSLPQVADTF
ncbi:hypothetical protein GF380_06645 [Candidatus Uhrbacteria bacterium]|nr:hypothetical protein [Candidatus Uhrbacteria bacterium]MBD3284613.1 hypothetical protein [Candidatus Uhrbacteria bacterium]